MKNYDELNVTVVIQLIKFIDDERQNILTTMSNKDVFI